MRALCNAERSLPLAWWMQHRQASDYRTMDSGSDPTAAGRAGIDAADAGVAGPRIGGIQAITAHSWILW